MVLRTPEDDMWHWYLGHAENNSRRRHSMLDVTIELNLSASGYVLTLLFGAIGFTSKEMIDSIFLRHQTDYSGIRTASVKSNLCICGHIQRGRSGS